jgi:glycine dehydrogenase subunit 1
MYIPHTPSETEEMLNTIGVKSISDLFDTVPEEYRFPNLDLPQRLTEMEALSQAEDISLVNESVKELVCFLGAGAYHHYIPTVVDSLLRRGEFFTAYTPYQPEVSQGTLQAIFEFQSLIAYLTGMEVCNASHYDGATATAEAAVLAFHNFRKKRNKFVLSPAVNPQYRDTMRTYLRGFEQVAFVGDDCEDPMASVDNLISHIDKDTALVVVQYPDFYGRITDLSKVAEAAHQAGAILAVATNPTALALLKPPSEMGADIVIGEGQPLGIPLSFGGPYLGFFATSKDYLRNIAGRLVGETVDEKGQRGYVLTLTAREQHIRRERATSNICTNQGLIALAATIYMSTLGKQGMKQVAELCYHKAHYAAKKISQIPGYSLCHEGPFFHEFVVCCPKPVSEINTQLLDYDILGGYDLGKDYPSLENHMLIAVTEMNDREEIDYLCQALQEINND